MNCVLGVDNPTTAAQASTSAPSATVAPVAPAPEVQMDWKKVTQLLAEKLTTKDFEGTLRYSVRVHAFKLHSGVKSLDFPKPRGHSLPSKRQQSAAELFLRSRLSVEVFIHLSLL